MRVAVTRIHDGGIVRLWTDDLAELMAWLGQMCPDHEILSKSRSFQQQVNDAIYNCTLLVSLNPKDLMTFKLAWL